MNGNEEHESHPRGVSSLLSQFEALAAGAHLPRSHPPQEHTASSRKFTLSHLPLPHLGGKTGARHRAASDPPSPTSTEPTVDFGDRGERGKHQKTLKSSPSQPSLRHRSGSVRELDVSDGPHAIPLPLRTFDADPDLSTRTDAISEKPLVPPRPAPPSSAGSDTGGPVPKPRRAPPPPVPGRKKAATIAVDPPKPVSEDPQPSLPHGHRALTIAGPSDAGIAIPVGRRPSDIPSSASVIPPPRSREPSGSEAIAGGGLRSHSPLEYHESDDALPRSPAPSIPPRPQADASSANVTASITTVAPPLPLRKPSSQASGSSSTSIKPPMPSRVDHLSSSLPVDGRRASEADVAVPVEGPGRSPEMRKTQSDHSRDRGFLPPPTRNGGVQPAAAPRPNVHAASHSDSEEEEEEVSTPERKAIEDLPDSTFASRLAPELSPPRVIHSKSTVSSVTAHGTHLVTCGAHHLHVYVSESGTQVVSISLPGEPKTTVVEFRGPKIGQSENQRDEDGRHVWVGCKDGQLFGVDLLYGQITCSRSNAHGAPVTSIFRRNTDMLTIDESGKVQAWIVGPNAHEASLRDTTPRTFRIEKAPFAALFGGDKLWTATHVPRTGSVAIANRAPLIRVYAPFAQDPTEFVLMPRPIQPPDTAGPIGAVTAAATLQAEPTHVYLGHETGHISIWSSETFECLEVLRISGIGITALCGAGPLLWTGYRSGIINVYQTQMRPWKVIKAWKAHKDAVTSLFVDASTLWLTSALHVISIGLDQMVHFWDGFLQSDWVCYHSQKREAEFCTYDSLRILVCSWNLDAAKPSDLVSDPAGPDFLPAILSSVDAPDVIVFGFQEMIDLEDKRLTASAPSDLAREFNAEKERVEALLFGRKRADAVHLESISSQYRLWHEKLVRAVRLAMPAGQPYSISHTESLVGLFTCVFVKNSIRLRLRDLDTSIVKTGLGGLYGNKGAIVARFVIDDSSICFVNCHLAAGQSHKRQRNKDLIEILETKAPFAEYRPSSGQDAWISGGDGAMIFDHSVVILSGDLNYRVDLRRDTVMNNIQASKLDPLLAQDQLLKEMRTNASFRLKSFTEAPITFAPTYKYDRHSDTYDSSEKARAPAWCDRILWRINDPDVVQSLHYRRHEARISDHRPISAGFTVRTRRINYEQKRAVEAEIAKDWPAYKQSLIAKSRAFHVNMR